MIEENEGLSENEAEELPQLEIDPMKMQQLLQKLRDEQNLIMGIAAGLIAALISAVIWAVVTALTNYQIGWMAIGVGIFVGFAVKKYGKGIDTGFGIVGGVLAALGCAVGNLLAVIIMVSKSQGIGILELASQLTPQVVVQVMKATFQPMDAIFYLIGLYEGYQFSFRQLTEEELLSVARDDNQQM